MGCSPSKGNNLGTQGPFRRGRMLLPATQDSPREFRAEDGESRDSTASRDGDTRQRKSAGQTQSLQRETPLTPQKKRSGSGLSPEAVDNLDNNTVTQGKEKQDMTDRKSGRKPKKTNKGMKPVKKKEKDKKAPPSEEKVDFPDPLVKAHQAAYAFLNPSINTYGILLGLLEQVTQTQVSVQPMVTFMALRYEEIIRGLKEMADEGEKLLKENGEHLAWPSQMKNLSSSTPSKSASAKMEPPPDLLQQLLQYTTQRMRNVSQTVSGIGDSALEEAVEYFASVSELLEEKLKAKHAAEARLMQLLTRIETASLRRPGPEDSALFSEDSGIGAESESLAGSERRHRRESCESTGTSRTTSSPLGYHTMNIRQGASRRKLTSRMSPSVSLTSIDSTCTIMAKEQKDSESLLGSVSLDDGEEDEDDDDDDDDMDGDMGNMQVSVRMQSNSSPVDPEQPPRRLPPRRIENPQNVEMTLKMKDAISGRIQFVPTSHVSAKTKIANSPKTSRHQWAEDEERSPKRPQTAAAFRRAAVKKTPVAKERRSRSAESLRIKGEDQTLLELERTQKDLSQRLDRMSKGRAGGNTRTLTFKPGNSPGIHPGGNRVRPALEKNNPQPLKEKAGLTRRSAGEQEVTNDSEDKKKREKKTLKGPVRATPPPSPPASPRPSSRGRNSVKKLIDTFSQGLEEQEGVKVLGPLKGVRRCGVPVLPGLGNVEAVLSTGKSSCRPESTSSVKTYDLDLDSLPPPPLEVLMDNSFESAHSNSAEDGSTKGGKSPVPKRAVVSRLRASVQSVSVLPSKGSLPQGSRVISPARADQRDSPAQSRISQPDAQPEADPEKEKTAVLYKQARKIIHLQHSSDASTSHLNTKPFQSAEEQHGGSLPVPEPNTTVPLSSAVSSQPPPATPPTPPTSKTRMLPSTPSTPSGLHRRLPSPHTLRKPPTPPSSTSPPANRKLLTSPAVQRRLPSPPVAKQNVSHSVSSHSFKAPSPPASPKVQRWSRENSVEDSSSRLVSNARSVFCPASPSLFEAHPCPAPRPPQAWTSTGFSVLPRPWGSRGRFPISLQGPQPFIRRSHSDRRPSLNLPPRSPSITVAQSCGSEPVINTQGLEEEPTRDELWSSHSRFRATPPRSASYPDLCIIGEEEEPTRDELWSSQSRFRATPPRSASYPDLCIIGQALHRD
ncbi:photoreceptor cilium actin regulator [Diretmus argenteus]